MNACSEVLEIEFEKYIDLLVVYGIWGLRNFPCSTTETSAKEDIYIYVGLPSQHDLRAEAQILENSLRRAASFFPLPPAFASSASEGRSAFSFRLSRSHLLTPPASAAYSFTKTSSYYEFIIWESLDQLQFIFLDKKTSTVSQRESTKR